MRTPPLLPYSGLTLILSNPSRFDTSRLLTGFAGSLVIKQLGLPLEVCDVRDTEEDSPLLPGTKVVTLLGDKALSKYNNSDSNLNQLRGIPWEAEGIIFIASYLPQDSCDAKAQYEQDHNPYYSAGDDDYESGDEKSTKGRTARSNYRFWLSQDLRRARTLLQRLKEGWSLQALREVTPVYKIYPSIEEVISVMRRDSNTIVDIDIETNYDRMMTVIGLSFNSELEVWVVPLVRYDGQYAYDELWIGKFLRALFYIFSRCIVVAHNGASFDFPFLAMNYRIAPPKKCYDTMLVHARLFPGVEKSLGHCGSLYTWEPYHKNEGVFNPHNSSQEMQLWEYNGKDVWLMKLVRIAQEREIRARVAGESVAQVNASIYPYVCMSLLGIRYDKEAVERRIADDERRLVQLARVLKALVGHDMLPTSNKSCVNYFHKELGLKVVKTTEAGNPSLDKKNLYKLYIANTCPAIPLALEFRHLSKEAGMLKFTPYKDYDQGNTTV